MRSLYLVAPLALALMANASAQAAQQNARAEAIEMRGVDLYMHSTDPTFGELRDPTFWVHAERGRLQSELRVWSLENAKAVIYRDPEDDIRLEAQQGTFDQTNQVAVLQDGVKAVSRDLMVELEDIQWNNDDNVAWSELPARVTSGANRLIGASVAIYPKDDRIELGPGDGEVRLAQVSDGEKPAAETPQDATDQYESIKIDWSGQLVGNLSGTLQKITDGVHLVIIAKEPQNSLDIKAELVEFEYTSPEEPMPARMHLEDNVVVTHQNGVVRAEVVDLDFETGEVMFTGNPRVDMERIRGVRPSSIQLNLNTGELVMLGPGKIEEIPTSLPDEDDAEAAERP